MAEFEQKEKAEGLWRGNETKFNRVFSGHRFTDEEVQALLDGKEIEVRDFVNKKGSKYAAIGMLEKQEYNGNEYVGFKIKSYISEFPKAWCEHEFTEEEKDLLLKGEKIHIDNCTSSSGSVFSCDVTWGEEDGRMKIIPEFPAREE
jgi:DNA topoisomerase-3